jgi:predicted SAM-dependent methyltransferase
LIAATRNKRAARAGLAAERAIKRLNWGCGSHVLAGWINSDVKEGPGIDVSCDIRQGLPIDDDSIDYAVSIHALQELGYADLVPALKELRRVLKPGGLLRLALPDLRKGLHAYMHGHDDYFKVDNTEVKSRGGRFIVHMLWYGSSKSLFTVDFIEELLLKAGFVQAVECEYRRTECRFSEIIELDNREDESLYIEATKPTKGRRPTPTTGDPDDMIPGCER